MAESILDYEKRPIRYNAIDGVDEMLVGFVFLGLPLLMHVGNIAPEGSLWRWKPVLLIEGPLLVIISFVCRSLLKQRVTYRRTGYVKLRYSRARVVIAAIVSAVVGLVITIYVLKAWRGPSRDPILIALSSLLWAGFYVVTTLLHHSNRAYRYVIALLIALVPIAVISAFRNVRDISTLSWAVMGGCFLISGVITFWLYLRNTTPVETPSAGEV